jgi:hypothetical protein
MSLLKVNQIQQFDGSTVTINSAAITLGAPTSISGNTGITGNITATGTVTGQSFAGIDLDMIDDVVITSISNNEVLGYDSASGNWINKDLTQAGLAAVATGGQIGDLTDVSNVNPQNGQYLVYNSGSSQYENTTPDVVDTGTAIAFAIGLG